MTTLEELLRTRVARFVDRDVRATGPGQRGGFENVGLEPAYLQVMLGRARPDLMSYADPALQAKRDVHLGAARG